MTRLIRRLLAKGQAVAAQVKLLGRHSSTGDLFLLGAWLLGEPSGRFPTLTFWNLLIAC